MYGYVKSRNEAFDKYLINTHEQVRETIPKIYDEEVIALIKEAGGYVSLAHPISLRLDLDTLKEYIKYLKSLGMDSIEVYHPHHNHEFSKALKRLAHDEDMLISGGSDYHGPHVKPKLHLGVHQNKNKVLTLNKHILENRKK